MAFIDKNKPILVTGASGYIASWIIKMLTEDGYTVHGTVRNLSSKEKTTHLAEFVNHGKLTLFEADLLEEGSFKEAMENCELVIHTASPFFVQGIKNAKEQLIQPALEGTTNVLNTANEISTVKRVVLTSSIAAIYGDAIDIKNTNSGVFNEKDWNTTSTESHQPYSLSKTMAEMEAWKLLNEQEKWDLVVINPGFVMGPSLSKRTDSTSVGFLLSMVNGKFSMGVPDFSFAFVDVRDVAQAHIQAGILENASGRHVLVNETLNTNKVVAVLQKAFGNKYKLPQRILPNFLMYLFGPFQGFSWKHLKRNLGILYKFDNSYSKKNLKIAYRPLAETFVDHVDQLDRDEII